ncbi:light-regulated protein 1, chloroplastic-like [Rhodamnia argentea]|uniref:Light-regulated protein 1, chloroplastic-like n=1 Tax=Rhodamnia argentea TaxID=178133 RepID=A0ABM3HEU8_9MYRT|nr:light-regulated protein 1, chloroplastic-like [Rhodamnia argentea]
MRAALFLAPALLPVTPSKNLSNPLALPSKPSSSVSSRVSPAKASWAPYKAATVDSSPTILVSPAEASETIVGEACLADTYPKGINAAMQATKAVEREYPEYTVQKCKPANMSVFPEEVCDDLGGMFPYQRFVY